MRRLRVILQILICALIFFGKGSNSEGLLDILNPVTVVSKFLNNNPIVQGVNSLAGDITSLSGRSLTSVPLFISRQIYGSKWLSGVLNSFGLSNRRIINLGLQNVFTNELADALSIGNEDAKLNIKQLINKYGYPLQEHTIITTDGYILRLYRIPNSKHKMYESPRPVVFLMHGLSGSSDDWILMGPDSGLAYILADAGYDVWMGNARGNFHSRKHEKLDPDTTEFWNFSWDEIGSIDLPAMVDYVLDQTNSEKLFYIGHSQGTTAFWVLCSLHPEYNDKIRIMIALSPVAWMGNVVSPVIRILAIISEYGAWLLNIVGVGEMLPNSPLIRWVGSLICSDSSLVQMICYNGLFLTTGFDLQQLNTTMLPVILGHAPAGASSRQYFHYSQNILSRDFRRYDHGLYGNKQVYGREIPPRYRVNRITAPVSLFYSEKDWLAHPDDVNTLYKKLGNPVDIYLIPHKQFNHLDFIWGKHAKTLVFNRVLKIMQKF